MEGDTLTISIIHTYVAACNEMRHWWSWHQTRF